MANRNNGPWGYGVAPISRDGEDSSKTKWVRVGPVWKTQDGDLQLAIEAEPIEWSDPYMRRVVLIKQAENRSDDRGGRR